MVSARFSLALSYAALLVVSGFLTMLGVYLVLRFVPDYPITLASPDDLTRGVTSRRAILGTVLGASMLILGGLAFMGMTGGWLLAGWVLRPLKRINEAAQVAATGRLDHRIRLSGRNDEFRQLADAFDHMLERIDQAFATQERFAANASHELRTPLAVTATILDVARANPEAQDWATVVDRLRQTNARAIGIVEALLRLGDANAITASSEPLDLRRIAETVLLEYAEEAEQREVTIEPEVEFAPIVGDPTLLEQLVSNLVQNAIRHNSSPGSAWLSTTFDAARGMVRLRIENTGAVISASQAEKLIEPFLRGRGRIQDPGQPRGYGLGLALASRIIDLHGGELKVTPREGGGLIVVASFPSRLARS